MELFTVRVIILTIVSGSSSLVIGKIREGDRRVQEKLQKQILRCMYFKWREKKDYLFYSSQLVTIIEYLGFLKNNSKLFYQSEDSSIALLKKKTLYKSLRNWNYCNRVQGLESKYSFPRNYNIYIPSRMVSREVEFRHESSFLLGPFLSATRNSNTRKQSRQRSVDCQVLHDSLAEDGCISERGDYARALRCLQER